MKTKNHEPLVSFFLRAGIAISLIYAAIAAFLQPNNWIGFFPIWMTNIIPGTILLTLYSTYELILGFWLISNKKIYYASILTIITLSLIIISNITQLDIIFRDIPILFAAIALAIIHKE